ncbi:MAG: hypothetical protein KGR48_04890 [Alphaproteobacteria bacterium]|nr:hypothetical protein [Alphaproteobacteria bacterium]MDE2014115.1 hypothetical protein [Alphaproteobacteria bacterium]
MLRSCLALVLLGLFLALPPGARAADGPYTVSGVKIDATASSASEAFNFAVDGGRREAWDKLIHRLTRQQDWDRVPPIDDATLQRMISGYQLANEMRSTTRYVALATYTFNANLVRNFLRSANIAYTDSSAQPLLVIPLSPRYAPGSPWAMAWAGLGGSVDGVPLALPGSDAQTNAALASLNFGMAGWSDVQPFAARAHAGEAVLAQVQPPVPGQMQGQLTVKLRILSPGPPQVLPDVAVAFNAGSESRGGYGDAAMAAAGAAANAWKSRKAIDFSQQATLTANVQLASLAQWGAIQQKLASVPVVLNVDVAAMSIGEARIVLTYAGTASQLNDFLSQAALTLANRNGTWWLGAKPTAAAMENP